MAKMHSRKQKFLFRKLDQVGAPAAEEDHAFLAECFIDTGVFDVLRDIDDSRRVVVGRTGSGKTALLSRLEEADTGVIRIEPESLALPYVSNSTILDFVSRLGVKLDVFFRLLWRHVFAVELIRRHFDLKNADETQTFLQKTLRRFSSKKVANARALKYLEKWGSSFWEETDYRIKELTTNLEDQIKATLGAKLGPAQIGLEATRTMSTETRRELAQRAQQVINNVQITELSDIMSLLSDILDDSRQKYFIVIDRLDENWIDEKLRYLLIRALIETAKDFRKVQNAKIVVAIRSDLLMRVFRHTRDPGFQEEKYESLLLEVRWSEAELRNVLDKRIGLLVRERYTKKAVTSEDVLPGFINGQTGFNFMVSRTLLRPRDIIMFFNYCIQQATNSPAITIDKLKIAEGEYSRARLRAIADEWSSEYPNLMTYVEVLKKSQSPLSVSDISNSSIEDVCLGVATQELNAADELSLVAMRVAEGAESIQEMRRQLVAMFYMVGILGIKLEAYEAVCWTMHGNRAVSVSEINDDSRISIHPAFWRALGTKAKA